MNDSEINETVKRIIGMVAELQEHQRRVDVEMETYRSAARFVFDLATAENWSPPLDCVPPSWTAADMEKSWNEEPEGNR